MVTTINAYSVSLGLDASNYINSANLSRSETRALSRDIDAARDPVENFVREQNRLSAALNKGAIDIGTYNRLLEAKRIKYGQTEQSVLGFAKSLAGPLAIGLGTVAAGTTAIIATGTAFINHLKETQNQIDEVADSAGKLGVEYNALIGLRFAAQEAGGVDAAAVDAGIKKMQIALSKGSTAFAELGLDSDKLKSSGAVEAFSQIADKMSQIADHSDKLRIATEIFGKGGTELVSTLSQGSDAIAESVAFMERYSGLTDAQVLAVQQSNDAWDRVGIAVDGISTKLASEAAPAMLLIAEYALGTADSFEDIDGLLKGAVENAIGLAGAMKDLFDLNPIGLMLGEATDVGTAGRMLEELYKKRAELEAQAVRDKFDKNKEILELEDQSQKDLIDKLSREINDAASDRIRKEEQKRLDMQRRLSNEALKAADDHFKKERDNAKKLRDDIAKGPLSMEVGSADAAKYMADQVNQAIAAGISPDQPLPTDEQMLTEAQKQTELANAAGVKLGEMVTKLQALIDKKPEVAKFR